ncbi:MAG: ArnT family glycosyltransferase [Isosphaeraceae bacterium]
MTRSRRDRARATFLPACLIALVSAVATCGNAAWTAPPRFDGAGYAVLARACMAGQGYRAIDHPDRPRHAHFPPGYPLLLAATWSVTGESATAAHVVSILCTVGATLTAWLWFRRMMAGPSATLLGLALAVNWLWTRTGGAIQSEPLYMLLGQLTILAAVRAGRGTPSRRTRSAVALGALLAACLLTRHAAIGLAAAVLLDLWMRRGWRDASAVAAIAGLLVSPWLAWMATIGTEGRTQAGLLVHVGGTWFERIAGQLVFYVRRIPDQITGPFVEVGTVFRHSPVVALAADGWAVAASALIVGGWVRTLRRPRRRLAGMIAIVTMLVLLAWPFTEAGRFLVPLIPCLLIGAVEGLAAVVNGSVRVMVAIGARRALYALRPSRRRMVAAALVLAVSLPYSAYMLVKGRARAMEASHGDFDAACAWLAEQSDRPGPVLTRHPGEVFWQTGRQALEVPTSERPGDVDADADAIARTIATYRVAYLLIDQERYALAPTSPLARFVAEHPERVRKVWDREANGPAVVIYAVDAAGNPPP